MSKLATRERTRPSQAVSTREDVETKGQLARKGGAQRQGVVGLRKGGLPIAAEAVLGQRSQMGSQVLGSAAREPWWTDAIDQPHGERLVCAHRPAGQDQIERAPKADDLGQTNSASVDEGDADAPTEHAKDRISVCDTQIAEQRKLETACNGVAGDGGNERLAELHARGPHGGVGDGAVRRDGEQIIGGAIGDGF